MIIDPPTPFDPLAEWMRFRREMQRQLDADPGNVELREWRDKAAAMERELSGG